jgi:NAD(P)-dependent dehydrogenase (short-subunit alcohol dehydrogenase family)
MKDLNGKVAVVTGAANGIGLGLAEALADQGCSLVLLDVETDALAAVAARLGGRTEVLSQTVDVADAARVQAAAAATRERFGGAQLLFANAGVTMTGRPTAAMSMNDWQWVVGANLFGVIHSVNAFLPLLNTASEAHIVITASGICSFAGIPLNAPYCATKAAVLSYAESLYHEHKLFGSTVGVSALCPGTVPGTLAESERRRPAHLPDLCETDPAPPGVRERLAAIRDEGLPVAEVARMTLDAIREDRFYVITHPENGDIVEARGKNARAGRNPEIALS